MFTSEIRLSPAPSRLRARTALLSSLLSSAALLFVTTSAWSQSSTLGPVVVSPPKPQTATRQGGDAAGRAEARQTRRAELRGKAGAAPVTEPAPTPLNSNVVAGSASHLGLTAHEMPASVEVVSQQTMREQGYRTTTESAAGAVGVLSGDAAGAPAGFSMRGFTFSEVTVLYNGIWIGPQGLTSRMMDTANLQQVEFVKGPDSLMSGVGTIGGTVNYVSRQPTTGPIKSELDTSIDTLGTYRTHFGSGGSTLLPGLDYRFDVSSSRIDSRIDGVNDQLNNFSGQLNYRVTDSAESVGRGRVQARRRPRLLGHAADDDGVFRAVLDPRRRRGIGDQYVHRRHHCSRHRRFADDEHQLQHRRQSHRRA